MSRSKRKKIKGRPQSKTGGQHAKGSVKAERLSGKWKGLLFAVLLLGLVGFKINCIDRCGTSYDESLTFRNYTGSIHNAVTIFDSTNNHVLNSVLISIARKHFASYEHVVRIPSGTAGVVFTLALGCIIYKVIESYPLRIATLIMISFIPFVFHFSYMARGYSFAMAAVFAQLVLVIRLLKRKINFRYFFVPALLISALNFFAFGAMLSSMLIVAAFNITFVLFCSHRIFKDPPGRLKATVAMGMTIFASSFAMLFWLYRHIYMDIIHNPVLHSIAKGWKGWPSLVKYMNNILVRPVFNVRNASNLFGWALLYVFATILTIAIIGGLYRSIKAARSGEKIKGWKDQFVVFAFTFTILTLVFMFIYSVVFNKSLGLGRNNIFVVPLVYLISAIAIDRFTSSLKPNGIRMAVAALAGIVMIAAIGHHLPGFSRAFGKGSGTLSGPLVRKLKAIDPDRTWGIGFSKKQSSRLMDFLYYEQFGYNFTVRTNRPDVVVCSRGEAPPDMPRLKFDYLKYSNTVVLVSRPIDKKWVIWPEKAGGR